MDCLCTSESRGRFLPGRCHQTPPVSPRSSQGVSPVCSLETATLNTGDGVYPQGQGSINLSSLCWEETVKLVLTRILTPPASDREPLVSPRVGGGDHPRRSSGVWWGLLGLLWLSVQKAVSSWDGEDTSGHSKDVVVEEKSPWGDWERIFGLLVGHTWQVMGRVRLPAAEEVLGRSRC